VSPDNVRKLFDRYRKSLHGFAVTSAEKKKTKKNESLGLTGMSLFSEAVLRAACLVFASWGMPLSVPLLATMATQPSVAVRAPTRSAEQKARAAVLRRAQRFLKQERKSLSLAARVTKPLS
jgi:hypothetical protein